MKRIFLLLSAVFLSAFAVLPTRGEQHVRITVSGYTGSETLANFPVLVRLAEYDPSTEKGIIGFSYEDCATQTGADVYFTDLDGNEIPREIDTWNTVGESTIWVSVPKLARGTVFMMHYGDATRAEQATALLREFVPRWRGRAARSLSA